MITRRFLVTSRLQVLLNFVTAKGYDTANYKVLTTFPRRDVSIHMHCSTYVPFVNIIPSVIFVVCHVSVIFAFCHISGKQMYHACHHSMLIHLCLF